MSTAYDFFAEINKIVHKIIKQGKLIYWQFYDPKRLLKNIKFPNKLFFLVLLFCAQFCLFRRRSHSQCSWYSFRWRKEFHLSNNWLVYHYLKIDSSKLFSSVILLNVSYLPSLILPYSTVISLISVFNCQPQQYHFGNWEVQGPCYSFFLSYH